MKAEIDILLLEDDEDFILTLKELLEGFSCRVTTANNGVEGLQQVMASDFDVILCDLVMPTFPGDKFYVAVERAKPHLASRFIFMTGHQADPKWDRFVREVDGLLLWKPFQAHELLSALRTVKRKSRGLAGNAATG